MTAVSDEGVFLKALIKYGEFCGWFWSSLDRVQRRVRGLPCRAYCGGCGKRISSNSPGFTSRKAVTPLVAWSCPDGCDVENYPESFRSQVSSKSEDFRGRHVLGEPEQVVEIE